MSQVILHLIEDDGKHGVYRFDDCEFRTEFKVAEMELIATTALCTGPEPTTVEVALTGRPEALFTTADTLDEAVALQMTHLNSRVRELEREKAGLVDGRKDRRTEELLSAVLEAESWGLEFPPDAGDWPRVDSIERRLLDEFDPMARDIRLRLGVGPFAPVWVRIDKVIECYSEYTQEEYTLFGIECDGYAIERLRATSFGIDTLIRWIEGDDDALEITQRERVQEGAPAK